MTQQNWLKKPEFEKVYSWNIIDEVCHFLNFDSFKTIIKEVLKSEQLIYII